jgi:hypothetical protein
MNLNDLPAELPADEQAKARVIQLTAEQINKDFGSQVVDLEKGPLELEHLLDGVRMYLQTFPWRNSEKLAQQLYRVDLKERIIRDVIKNPNISEGLEDLTNEIVRREVLKILMRSYFSSSKPIE